MHTNFNNSASPPQWYDLHIAPAPSQDHGLSDFLPLLRMLTCI